MFTGEYHLLSLSTLTNGWCRCCYCDYFMIGSLASSAILRVAYGLEFESSDPHLHVLEKNIEEVIQSALPGAFLVVRSISFPAFFTVVLTQNLTAVTLTHIYNAEYSAYSTIHSKLVPGCWF
jgi:hypothetical protein